MRRIFLVAFIWSLAILYEGYSKRSNPHPERKAVAEHFCHGKTLPLLIKLEKLIQIFLVPKRSKPDPERRANGWTFLSWQNTTTSSKTSGWSIDLFERLLDVLRYKFLLLGRSLWLFSQIFMLYMPSLKEHFNGIKGESNETPPKNKNNKKKKKQGFMDLVDI